LIFPPVHYCLRPYIWSWLLRENCCPFASCSTLRFTHLGLFLVRFQSPVSLYLGIPEKLFRTW
jgi:hypothetical protein